MMEHSPILVLVAPHWATWVTGSVTEEPIGLRYLTHCGTVVLALLVCDHPGTSTPCAPRTRKCLPNRILCLNANVLTHLLTISRKALLCRSPC